MGFNTLEELYKKVKPALTIKVEENNNVITEREIWDYLAKEKWTNSVDLTLSEIVDDILDFNITDIDKKV